MEFKKKGVCTVFILTSIIHRIRRYCFVHSIERKNTFSWSFMSVYFYVVQWFSLVLLSDDCCLKNAETFFLIRRNECFSWNFYLFIYLFLLISEDKELRIVLVGKECSENKELVSAAKVDVELLC